MKTFFLIAAIFALGVVLDVPSMIESPSVVPDPYSGVLVVDVVDGQGSCFVVARTLVWWYAITAAHVIEVPSWANVDWEPLVTVDDEAYDAEIVSIDANRDMALLRFKSPEQYKIYSFAKTTVEAPCTTVGFSRGSRLVYKGHIVSLNLEDFIVANGGVVPGCSGGVLLDAQNRVVGITVQIAGYEGYGLFDSTAFYVPSRFAEALLIAAGVR